MKSLNEIIKSLNIPSENLYTKETKSKVRELFFRNKITLKLLEEYYNEYEKLHNYDRRYICQSYYHGLCVMFEYELLSFIKNNFRDVEVSDFEKNTGSIAGKIGPGTYRRIYWIISEEGVHLPYWAEYPVHYGNNSSWKKYLINKDYPNW